MSLFTVRSMIPPSRLMRTTVLILLVVVKRLCAMEVLTEVRDYSGALVDRSVARQVRQRPTEHQWLHKNVDVLNPLIQHTARAVIKGEFGAREVANVAYGVACNGLCKAWHSGTTDQPVRELFEVLA